MTTTVMKPTDYAEIKEKSAEDIVKVLRRLYNNQDEMLTIATKGREKILKSFDAKKNVISKYKLIKRN